MVGTSNLGSWNGHWQHVGWVLHDAMSVSLQTVIVHLNGISSSSHPDSLRRWLGWQPQLIFMCFRLVKRLLHFNLFKHVVFPVITPYVIVHVLSNGGSASVRAPGTSWVVEFFLLKPVRSIQDYTRYTCIEQKHNSWIHHISVIYQKLQCVFFRASPSRPRWSVALVVERCLNRSRTSRSGNGVDQWSKIVISCVLGGSSHGS